MKKQSHFNRAIAGSFETRMRSATGASHAGDLHHRSDANPDRCSHPFAIGGLVSARSERIRRNKPISRFRRIGGECRTVAYAFRLLSTLS
jgi:hypothetical protein